MKLLRKISLCLTPFILVAYWNAFYFGLEGVITDEMFRSYMAFVISVIGTAILILNGIVHEK